MACTSFHYFSWDTASTNMRYSDRVFTSSATFIRHPLTTDL